MKWKKSFFTVAVGQTISLVGSSAVQFSLIWWLASETSSAMVLAMAGLMTYLPIFFLSPFAGVWVDRLKRKLVVITADLFMGVVAVLFAGWFLMNKPPYWSVYLVLGVRAVGSVFHTPAIQSMIPMIVPAQELVRANGWSQFMQSGAFMLGPVLGGIMYGVLPMPMILLTDFIGAVAASITVAVTKVPEIKQNSNVSPHFFHELKEGIAVFGSNQILRSFLITATICMLFYMPLSSLYPLMTSSFFQLDAFHASIAEFLFALGMMAVSLFLGIHSTFKNKVLVIHVGLWGLGITSLLCGILPPTLWAFWAFALLCLLMGACGNLYGVPLMAYMQEIIPPQVMGRAFSLWGMMMSATMPLGLLLSGPIAQRYGVVRWFLISGVVIIIAVTFHFFFLKRQKNTAS